MFLFEYILYFLVLRKDYIKGMDCDLKKPKHRMGHKERGSRFKFQLNILLSSN